MKETNEAARFVLELRKQVGESTREPMKRGGRARRGTPLAEGPASAESASPPALKVES